MPTLEDVLKGITKEFGEGSIGIASKMTSLKIARIPTGSLTIDIATGGGYPLDRVTCMVGEESCGKTVLALKGLANAQKYLKAEYEAEVAKYNAKIAKCKKDEDKKKVPIPVKRQAALIDVEGTFDAEWAEKLGIDLDDLLYTSPETGEEAGDIIDALVRSGCCGFIALDSIAAMSPEVEAEGDMDDNQPGTQARMMNKFYRKLGAAMNAVGKNSDIPGPAILTINQPREKIGVMYGDPTTYPGGKGQKFANSILLKLRRAEWIQVKVTEGEESEEEEEDDKKKKDKGNKEVVGLVIQVIADKNKTAPAKRGGQVRFFFKDAEQYQAGSFDVAEEVVRLGVYYGLIERSGAMYNLKGDDVKVKGLENFTNQMRELPEIIEKMQSEIRQLVLHQ